MTITVTPDPLYAPPRNEVEVSVASGAIMESVRVWRTANGVSTDLRAQPSPGFTTRTVYDYEAPYGVACTYTWQATYLSTASLTTVWTETWASLAAWTTSGASWGVSGGRLEWSSGDDLSAFITRSVTPGRYRISLARAPYGIASIDFGGFQIDVVNSRMVAGAVSVSFASDITAPSGWLIDVTPSAVILTTSIGSYSLPVGVTVSQVRFVGALQLFIKANLRWGLTVGSGNGQFDIPGGVVSFGGYVYVVDTGNNRIQKFNATTGAYVTQWGTAGSGNGQFNSPSGIAADAAGNIYVTDRFNFRVQKFAPPGSPTNPHTYATQWGASGTGDGQFTEPRAITVDASNSVYVTDMGVGFSRTQKFTNTGTFVNKFGSYGSGDGQFQRPYGIVVDSAGYIYVLDNALHRVMKFSSAFAYVTQWGTQGSGNGQLSFPNAMAIDGNNSLYIVDDGNDRVVRFNPVSALVPHSYAAKFGSYGSGDGQFTNPVGVAIVPVLADRDAVYITDVLNGVTALAQIKAKIDDVTVSSYNSVPVTVTETSDPVTLLPEDGWLVHPATPGLSFPIHSNPVAGTYPTYTSGITEIGAVGNDSNATVHRILGSDTPVVTTNGNRQADTGSLVVAIETKVEEDAMKALLRDETPLLINFPPSMETGFDYGFYQVGDTTRERIVQNHGWQLRDYVLPLTQVQSPAVTQQNTGWSYAGVLVEYSTYADLLPAYSSYADLLTDSRN